MKENQNAGKLYLIATPIGNLEDITLRALRILKEVYLIAAEDTRKSKILLNHYQIKTKMVSYHAHNEHQKTRVLLEKILSGTDIAVLSDAGTPSIADPGFLLVREAVKSGISPIIIPGPSALTFSVVACGLPVNQFTFFGFLPIKKGKRLSLLQEISTGNKTAFIFASPHKIGKLLYEIAEICGEERHIAIIREASKMYEEILRGSVKEILSQTAERKWKGECTIAIAPEDK